MRIVGASTEPYAVFETRAKHVKHCVNCSGEIPASAAHCVYCGSRQPGPAADDPKRTMLGHPGMAQELAARARPSQPPPAADPFAATGYLDPQGGPGRLGGGGGFGGPSQGGPGYGPGQAPDYRGGPVSPGHGPPPAYPGPGPAAPYGSPPPEYHRDPSGFGPPPGAFGPPPGAFGPPPDMPFDSRPAVEPPRPRAAPLPHPGRAGPFEPWADSLRTALLVFGVLLVACFVAPWGIGEGEATFAWTLFRAPVPFAAKMLPVLLAGTGLLAVVFGAAPLSATARGFAAAALGTAPLVFQVAATDPFAWQSATWTAGLVALLCGLVLRSQYTGSWLARGLVTSGAIIAVLVYLVPVGDQIPVVALAETLLDGPVTAELALDPQGPVPLLLIVLSLLVWLPASTRAGAAVIAWLLLAFPVLATVALAALADDPLAAIKSDLFAIVYLPVATMAWLALSAYGIATVCGKQLEDG